MSYKQTFIKFLKANHAFEEWKKEVEKDKLHVKNALNYMNNKHNAPQVLDNGIIFFYDESERRGFWNNLNMKWKEKLRCLSKEKL